MNSIYTTGLMSGSSPTETHNRLSALLAVQVFVLLLRSYVAFMQILMLFFPSEINKIINWFGCICIAVNFLGDVIFFVAILVEMHKRAVGTLEAKWSYRLQVAKAAWVVGGWVVLLGVYRGTLVMMLFDWTVWTSLMVDLVYLMPFVGALVLVMEQRRENYGVTLL